MGKVLTCDCKHTFQDKVYGPAQRLHLPCAKDAKLTGYRCSVCGKDKELPREDKKV